MIGSFQTGVSGLQTFQKQLEVIGNNIANVNTVGFKTSHMEFQDALNQNLITGANPMQVGTGVATAAIKSLFTGGSINPTGNTTDLAISGNGFFLVRDPANSITYGSRDGQFIRDADGYLVNNTGLRVQGYVGPGAPYATGSTIGDIQINAAAAITALGGTDPTAALQSFSIDSHGQVYAILTDGNSGVMAQVVLQSFTNPQALLKEGNNVYSFSALAGPLSSPAAPDTNGLGTIFSGALEGSNVDLSVEMTAMITAQRSFEANAKIVSTTDEVLQTLVNLKR